MSDSSGNPPTLKSGSRFDWTRVFLFTTPISLVITLVVLLKPPNR